MSRYKLHTVIGMCPLPDRYLLGTFTHRGRKYIVHHDCPKFFGSRTWGESIAVSDVESGMRMCDCENYEYNTDADVAMVYALVLVECVGLTTQAKFRRAISDTKKKIAERITREPGEG